MRVPGLPALNKYLEFRYIPLFLLALVINILVFFTIQLMVTGKYSGVSINTFQSIDNFIRVRRDMTPPDMTEETTEPQEPVVEEDLPPPKLPMPMIAPPAPVSPVSTPVSELDIDINTRAVPNLNRILSVTRARPSAPKIATNLVPTVRVNPVYPQNALNQGIEGIVTVEFTIATDGSVKDPVIVKSIPEKVFDKAVMQVFNKWKYSPELVNGRPVEIRARQDVTFILGD